MRIVGMNSPQESGSRANRQGTDSGQPGGDVPGRLKHWHILLLVLASTFAAYSRTLGFEFVHDDFLQIVNNPALHSWSYLPQYFTEHVWAAVYPGTPGNYYRPIFLIWCRLNDAAFGNQAGWWHLTTVLAHLAATAMVYFLVLRLVQDRLSAGIAALVFGLDPIHIEAVAWISGVTEPLLGVFLIGSFLCYLKAREEGARSGPWMGISLSLYILGMLEKETTLILPALICVYEWLYGTAIGQDHGWRSYVERALRAVRAAAAFFLLIIPYLAVRIAALKGFSHFYASIPVVEVLYTWPALVWFWIRHLLVPAGLSTFYDLRTVEHPGLWNFVLPAAAVAATIAVLGWGALRSRAVAFAAAWIILPLIPVLDIRVLPQNDFAHDRYLYLPSVGLAIIIALAFRRLKLGRARLLGYPAAQVVCPLLLAIVLGFGTLTESFYFANNWIFYRYGHLYAPRNVYAANNYGVILGRLGMNDQAIQVLEEAAREDPKYWSATYNLGCAYYQLGKFEPAAHYLFQATQINPGKSAAYFWLGYSELKMGKVQEAKRILEMAIQLSPQEKEYHYVLGLVLEKQGDLKGALEEFRTELAVNPRHPEARREARQLEARLRSPATKSGRGENPR